MEEKVLTKEEKEKLRKERQKKKKIQIVDITTSNVRNWNNACYINLCMVYI